MKKKKQSGGFGLGLIVGLLSGLALALAVALYVTKVPIPFVNKLPPRASSEREAEESERNKNWDPNAPLHGNRPARPAATAAAPATAPTAMPAPATVSKVVRPPDETKPQAAAGSVTEASPAAAEPPTPRTMAAPTPNNASSRNPALPPGNPPPSGASPAPADLSDRQAVAIFSDRPAPLPGESALSTKSRDDPFIYYVQAGAYGRQEDAEQQRATLAMMGMEAKVTEREQAGRTVFRVRVGPFDKRERADEAKNRLAGVSMDGVLVRVQK